MFVKMDIKFSLCRIGLVEVWKGRNTLQMILLVRISSIFKEKWGSTDRSIASWEFMLAVNSVPLRSRTKRSNMNVLLNVLLLQEGRKCQNSVQYTCSRIPEILIQENDKEVQSFL